METDFMEMTLADAALASQAPTARQAATLVTHVKAALMRAMDDQSALDPAVLDIPGMSGSRYRRFVNNLVASLPDPRYLEIGSWAGSTLCSAINRNAVRATAIDNWSQFGGPKDIFMQNLQAFRTGKAYVNFIENDFRQVDFPNLGPFDVYLFDGPHEVQDQFDGLAMALPALDPAFVFIVDDWNWAAVRDGTNAALKACNLTEHYRLEIRTSLDDTQPPHHGPTSHWHNGYYVGVLTKA